MDNKEYEEYVEKFAKYQCDGDTEEAKKHAMVKAVKVEGNDKLLEKIS